jgi:hypothetical protein
MRSVTAASAALCNPARSASDFPSVEVFAQLHSFGEGGVEFVLRRQNKKRPASSSVVGPLFVVQAMRLSSVARFG